MFTSEGLLLAARYAEMLADAGVLRGLIGPREVPRLWDRHLLNCAALGGALDDAETVADIGSGAGLPGLVVAVVRPQALVTLVEPLLRRTTFLLEVARELGLENVEVVRGRAETLHGRRVFDVVTSRAVAPLARLLEWSMPLVAPDGRMMAMKGSSAGEEIREARPVLEGLGCGEPELLTLAGGLSPATVVSVAWRDPARVSWRSSRSGPAGGVTPRKKSVHTERRRGR